MNSKNIGNENTWYFVANNKFSSPFISPLLILGSFFNIFSNFNFITLQASQLDPVKYITDILFSLIRFKISSYFVILS